MRKIPAPFFFVLSLFISQSVTAQVSELNERPNFIIILADDLGYGDLGYTGSTQIQTPNIDKLASSGIEVVQGYVSAPVCSPSRAGLLTGVNQVKFGHDNNLGGTQLGFDPEFHGLPIDQQTIAKRLQRHDYATGLVGKWHLGTKQQFHPLNRGFDEFWGFTGGGHDYFSSSPNGKGYSSPIECNYKIPDPITYITDDIGNESVDFIERHRGEPFFLVASFNAPHTPMQALDEDLEKYSFIEDKKRRTYAAMVHRLDENVGRIIAALESNNIRERTLIVFLSDNGGPVRSNGSINAPYNGQKGILLEGGVHVPFIFSWPGKLESGKKFEDPLSSLDLAPTFYELAGGTIMPGEFDGKNIVPFLHNEISTTVHHELKWRFTISAAIREGDWKLIRLPDRLPLLFHLPTDISEQNNVALENPEKTAALLRKLGDWDVSLPHPVFLEGAEWKRNQLNHYDRIYQLKQPGSK